MMNRRDFFKKGIPTLVGGAILLNNSIAKAGDLGNLENIVNHIMSKKNKFSTTFDSWQGIRNGNGRDDWVIPCHYEAQWPSDINQNRAGFYPIQMRDTNLMCMKRKMDNYSIQHASVEFLAPYGIDDHIIIAVQGQYADKFCANGYFAILGYVDRLCNTPGRRCDNLMLGIEKAICGGNSLHSGIPILEFDKSKVHRLVVQTDMYKDKIRIMNWLYRYDPKSGWLALGNTYKDDEEDIIIGELSYFAPVFQSHPIYFDNFRVWWE